MPLFPALLSVSKYLCSFRIISQLPQVHFSQIALTAEFTVQDQYKYKREIFLNHSVYSKCVTDMQQPKRMCSGILNPSTMTQKINLACLRISNFNFTKYMLYL